MSAASRVVADAWSKERGGGRGGRERRRHLFSPHPPTPLCVSLRRRFIALSAPLACAASLLLLFLLFRVTDARTFEEREERRRKEKKKRERERERGREGEGEGGGGALSCVSPTYTGHGATCRESVVVDGEDGLEATRQPVPGLYALAPFRARQSHRRGTGSTQVERQFISSKPGTF